MKREKELREQLLRAEEEAASQTSKAAQLSRQLADKEEELKGKRLSEIRDRGSRSDMKTPTSRSFCLQMSRNGCKRTSLWRSRILINLDARYHKSINIIRR